MLIDLHIHTSRYSGCSCIEPEVLITRAQELCLEGIALTEHGILWPDYLLEALRKDAGPRLRVLVGQEVACYSHEGKFQGEFIVFGVDHSLGSNRSAEELVERVHSLNGIVIAAHPYKPSRTGTGFYGLGDTCTSNALDAIELGHPDHDEPSIVQGAHLCRSKNIPATGGSDAHTLAAVGAYVTECAGDVADTRDLVDVIRSGRVRPLKREGDVYVPLWGQD